MIYSALWVLMDGFFSTWASVIVPHSHVMISHPRPNLQTISDIHHNNLSVSSVLICLVFMCVLHVHRDVYHHWSLKRKCHHFNEIFITGCIRSLTDNFQGSQWWKFHQNDIFILVVTTDNQKVLICQTSWCLWILYFHSMNCANGLIFYFLLYIPVESYDSFINDLQHGSGGIIWLLRK